MDPSDHLKDMALGIPFLLGGIGCIYGAFHFYRRIRYKLKNWMTSSGTVTGYYSRQGSSFEFPEVQFEAQDGTLVTFRASFGTGGHPYRIGSKVRVYYSGSDPKGTADIKTAATVWMPVFVCVFFAVICAFLVVAAVFGH